MRNFCAYVVFAFLVNATAGHAQITDPAKAAAITGDKTGKYVFVGTDQTFQMRKGWFEKTHCAKPATGFIHLHIGEAHFRIPQESLNSVMAGALVMEQINGEYRVWHDANTGCPENPLVATRADIAPPSAVPADDLVLRQSSPNAAAFSQTLLKLRDHPNANCITMTGGRLACTGTFNGTLTSFAMVTDPALVQESGAPISLRCTFQPALSCGVWGDLPGGVSFQTAFPAPQTLLKQMTRESLHDLYTQMHTTVDGLRAAP